MIGAVAFCVQARGIDAEADKLRHHDVGTILRQLQIRRRIALSIRIAAHSRVDIRISPQNFGDVLQLLL
jgi:hypothetical protein